MLPDLEETESGMRPWSLYIHAFVTGLEFETVVVAIGHRHGNGSPLVCGR